MSSATINPVPIKRTATVGDLWGGFGAMLVVLPSSIAFGVTTYALLGASYVGHGVLAGILGAIALGLVAPLLGGAPRLISAPCAPAAAVLAALAGELIAGTRTGGAPIPPERVFVLLTLVTLLTGALQAFYGAIGSGRLIKFIPYPVISGYLSGVAVLIFLSQVANLFGVSKDVRLGRALATPELWQAPSLIVGAATIAGMLFAPKITRAVPATILGLLAGVLAYFSVAWTRPELLHVEHNALVIGPVGGGLSAVFSAFAERGAALLSLRAADVQALLMPALTLSVLLSIDTLKTCVVVDALTRSRHNSNRELIGQGAGNLAAALVGGLPGAGTMGATLVNVESGGRTRASGVLEGVFVLVAFVFFGKLIAWVPVAALAGILIVVAFRMFDWRNFQLLRQTSTMLDFGVIAAVVLVAVTVNLIAAAGAGLSLAILLFIREQIRGGVIRRKMHGDQLSSKQRRLPEEQAVLARRGAETTICELQGSLFFGTTDQLFTELEADLKQARYVILDMRRVRSVDFTGAHMLEQFEAMLRDHGGCLLFSRLPASLPSGQNLEAYFAQLGVTKPRESVRTFGTLDDALQWVEDRILEREYPQRVTTETPLALGEVDLLREFEADGTLAVLATCVVERSFAAGQTVFKSGENGDELFLIRRGTVRAALALKDGSYHNLAFFGRGDFFGEMAFLDRRGRSADAIATTPTELFVISRARFDEVCRTNALVGVKVFARIARALAIRLRYADAEMRALYEA